MKAVAEHEAIVDELAPTPSDHVLVKHRYGAFQRSNLADMLEARGRDQLLITGVFAHIGIVATAFYAFQHDIETFVAADAVAGVLSTTTVAETTDTEWRRVFAVNSDGVFDVGRAVSRVMAPRGRGAMGDLYVDGGATLRG